MTLTTKEFSKAITKASRMLRKDGILVKRRFSCCNGCACGELPEEFAKVPEATGALYVHQQAEGHYRESVKRGKPEIMFGFTSKAPDDDPATIAVGEAARKAFLACGLKVTWNGTVFQKLAVTAGE